MGARKVWEPHPVPDGHSRPAADALPAPGAVAMFRVGKKTAGRELDGRSWDELPEVAA